jgi:HEAT repeat protein
VPAQVAAGFFIALGRALRTCRLYRPDNPIVLQLRESLHTMLNEALATHGAWQCRITPFEIFLIDEAVVRARIVKADEDYIAGPEEKLPFLFYRDGIRGLSISPDVSRHDFESLFDALLTVTVGVNTQDDLVTLLWQANTVKIRIDAVPVTQTIYLHAHRPSRSGGSGAHQGQSYAWSPVGSEIRADIGQFEGAAAGLHKDTFDDWPLPHEYAEVQPAFEKLAKGMQFVRTKLHAEWSAEHAIDWQMDAQVLLEKIFHMDPSPLTRSALANAVITWLVDAIQRSAWDDGRNAFELLRAFDPDGGMTNQGLTEAMAGLDTDDITGRLDESENDDQARFFGLAVAMGRPAIDLATAVMAKAQKSRTRAAACTMLSYLCADQPEILSPYLADSRWYVVRNTVFVLGQIGGDRVIPLLELATQHPESRVRRAVVQALGNCPGPERVPLLLGQLDTRDPQLLAAVLAMLVRFRSPLAARAILRQVELPDFESRPADIQRALFGALGDLGDDEIVPRLDLLLRKGGWFARPTFQRLAVARILQRLGTATSLAVLESGLSDRSEAVRLACLEAIQMRVA